MKISNPLTIIAIFAGLAETLATVALVQLPLEIQTSFIYFVMFFPTLIVLLFFAVLYFKNTVLYAPGDYSNQNHYLEINKIKETVSEHMENFFTEINKKGQRLSREEIDKAKITIDESIEEVTRKSKKEEVLKFLTEHPASVAKIANELGLNIRTVQVLLYSLKKEHLVEDSTDRPKVWSIST